MRRSEGVYHAIGGRPNAAPDLARSIAFAREARRKARYEARYEEASMARETRARRLSGTSARFVAVLGLFVLASAAIAGFSAVREHADSRAVSLVAAADVPAARIREVDVMRKSSLTVVGAVMVATGASAGEKVPSGWMIVADAFTQFSNTQGQDGWTYHYDSGPGSTVQFMPFNPVWEDGTVTTGSWCIAPRVGCSGSDVAACHISSRPVDAPRAQMHTQSAGGCCSPQINRRPIVRWTADQSTPVRVRFTPQFGWIGHGGSFDVLFDGVVVLAGTEADQGRVFELEAPNVVTVELRENPGSVCAALLFELKVFAPACPGDVIANGIIDGADLSALLSVWGTDGGIYPRADTNGDGEVNGADLSAVLSGWGACP